MRAPHLGALVALMTLACAGAGAGRAHAAATATAAPEPDVASKVDVSAIPLEKPVAAGTSAAAHLVLLFKGDASHHWGAPLKILVNGSPPVAPEKKTLARTDAVEPGKDKAVTRLEFDVPFTATAKGDGALSVLVSMFVCTETVCDSVDRTVTWKVHAE
jgi:hypothetical protein